MSQIMQKFQKHFKGVCITTADSRITDGNRIPKHSWLLCALLNFCLTHCRRQVRELGLTVIINSRNGPIPSVFHKALLMVQVRSLSWYHWYGNFICNSKDHKYHLIYILLNFLNFQACDISLYCVLVYTCKNCYCKSKDYNANTEHPFSRLSMIYNLNIECHPEEDRFNFENGFSPDFLMSV